MEIVISIIVFYHLIVILAIIYFTEIKNFLYFKIKNFFKLFKHKEILFLVLSFSKLLINVGAGVASVSVVGYFIPPLEVSSITLIIVGFFGIILSFSGYYIERALIK